MYCMKWISTSSHKLMKIRISFSFNASVYLHWQWQWWWFIFYCRLSIYLLTYIHEYTCTMKITFSSRFMYQLAIYRQCQMRLHVPWPKIYTCIFPFTLSVLFVSLELKMRVCVFVCEKKHDERSQQFRFQWLC